MNENLYCVVQHSAAGYGNDPLFARGLETRKVTSKEVEKVRAAGGVALGYEAANLVAEMEMFPPGYSGFVPRASGTFTGLEVDGLRVYRPGAAGEILAALSAEWQGTLQELRAAAMTLSAPAAAEKQAGPGVS